MTTMLTLIVWIGWMLPSIYDSYSDRFEPWIVTYTALVVMKFIFLNVFLMLVSLPLVSILQDIKIEELELVRSTPINTGSMFIGEFMGRFPFFAFLIALDIFDNDRLGFEAHPVHALHTPKTKRDQLAARIFIADNQRRKAAGR